MKTSLRLNQAYLTLAITTGIFAILYAAGAMRYQGFASTSVFLNFFKDNAFLGVCAIGMTFVILSGGIDLSVGSMVGFTSILTASLIETHHLSPAIVIPLVLIIGALFGAGMGALIRFFDMAPFLVTLAGMFLARGMGLLVSLESITLVHPWFMWLSDPTLKIGENVYILPPMTTSIFLATLVLAIYLGSFTPFGRNIYAIGGNEQSAQLMGLPVGFTKIGVYTLSGFCSALSGLVFAMYTSSGYALAGQGLELDAIAAVVIGGTLLSGGVGHVAGTLLGVLILGVIQTGIMFEGTLSSWWTRIAVGMLLFVFVVLQRWLAGSLRKAVGAAHA